MRLGAMALAGAALWAGVAVAASDPAERDLNAGERPFEELGRDLDRLGRAAGKEAHETLEQTLDDVRKHLQALRAAGMAGWTEALDAYRKSLRDHERAQEAQDETEI